MNYGVVIVTYNRLELLQECLACCEQQTRPFTKIVIVDNCSTDGTDAYLRQLAGDRRYEILTQTENLGGAGGFKVGMEYAQTLNLDWLLIIDDDAMIEADYIEQCDRLIRRHPNLAACSGTVYTDGRIQTNHRRVIANRMMHLEKDVPLSAYEKKNFRYDLATFCGLLLRVSVIKKIGLPKAEYFIWYDDTEYSMRLRRFGGIVNVNAARLNHKTKVTIDGDLGFFARMNWRTYYGHRNRLDAVKHHCGRTTTAVILAEFFVFLLGARGMQLLPSKREQGTFIAAMLKDAMRDGYNGYLGKNKKYLP